jgi:uncharacterized membrane protein YdjX (TVP38/TMEM64 family)
MNLRKYLLIAILVSTAVTLYLSGATQLLSLEGFRKHHKELKSFVEERPTLAPMIYTLTYILIVSLSIPGATILTLTGGTNFFLN